MRLPFFFPFILLFILLSSFSEKNFISSFSFSSSSNKAGVYDRDSLLDEMPVYHKALDSVEVFKKALNNNKIALDIQIYKLIGDSVKWSASIKEIKRKELFDLQVKAASFWASADVDIQSRKMQLVQPLNEKITLAANELLKKKKLEAVLDKNELTDYIKSNPSAKVINVSKEMRKQLGIPKLK